MKIAIVATLIICGVLLVFNRINYGILLVALGSIIFYFRKGIELDLQKRIYRNFMSLFNHRIGKWKDLSDIEYVSVFSTKEFSLDPNLRVDHEPGVSETFDVIHVNLFYDTNKKITSFRTQDKKEAFNVAEEIAQLLNVDILDATERESKWL
ncbi:hypothetical protein [uncultured Winogradskyella sp.]|uniref:hypothetical protein n=1 Tax=uncultured Winogradskyella sp. TaxID=395353 RepID=UPI002623B1E3|nr:hypothetical protein [uncultured Winogradskyella sp.]